MHKPHEKVRSGAQQRDRRLILTRRSVATLTDEQMEDVAGGHCPPTRERICPDTCAPTCARTCPSTCAGVTCYGDCGPTKDQPSCGDIGC